MTKPVSTFSLLDYRDDPYSYYAELRKESPVHFFKAGFWTVNRYKDVVAALKRPDLFSSRTGIWQAAPVGEDPPFHTELRKIASRMLAQQRSLAVQRRIREIGEQIITRIQNKDQDQFELIHDVASQLPSAVIWELLGVREEIRTQCSEWLGQHTSDPTLEKELAELPIFEKEDPLSSEQRARFVRFLMVASLYTTRSLIGNATLALLRNPEQVEMIRHNRKLLPSAIEEALRYEAPVPLAERRATQDIELEGITIPAGAFVFLLLASANRDPEVFEEPDRFMVTRDSSKHVSFSEGSHYCLGAHLARIETEVALEGLFFQLKGLKAIDPLHRPHYIESSKLRGLRELHLRFEK